MNLRRAAASPFLPPPTMENLVAFAADSQFVIPARALLSSIERNWRPFDPSFGYLVLDCGLSAEDRAALERTVAQGSGAPVTFYACSPEAQGSAALTDDSHLSAATFARFELFRLISELPCRRILYIDSDALVLKDCQSIWATGGSFAARWRMDAFLPDEYRPGFVDALPQTDPFRKRLVDPAAHAFNAGVLLLKQDTVHAEIYRQLQEETARYGAWFLNADQSALNLVVQRVGIVHPLPYKYNVPQREMLRSKETYILHFIGKRKPWLPDPLPESQGGAAADALRRSLWNEYAPK